MVRLARRLAVLFFVVPAMAPVVAVADDTGWVINSFQAEVTVRHDSTLEIVETIEVDFLGLEKHGIYRDIPVKYNYDQKRYRVYRLQVLDVKDGSGRSWPFNVSDNDAYREIRIGDPDRLVRGQQTYVIRYSVSGALNGFEDHDELYWNVNGSRWGIPTRSTSAVVHLPPGSFQRATCYQGAQGSSSTCELTSTGDNVTYSTGELRPGEQLTIVAAMNKGAVAAPRPILEPRPRGLLEYAEVSPWTGGVALGVLLLGLLLLAMNWWRHGRDQVSLGAHYWESRESSSRPLLGGDPVIAQFEPPAGLRPAEVGTLLDERADTKDVTATIVDLAGRGFLRIDPLPKGDWKLTRTGGDLAELKRYERSFLEKLYLRHSGESTRLGSLRRHFSQQLREVEEMLYKDAMESGWFSSDPRHAERRVALIGVAMALLGGAAAFVFGAAAGWGLPGVALVLVGGAGFVSARYMPRRTPKGSQLLREVLGFRLYMRTAERYRQQFAEKENVFTAFLPYAIVFGCAERWAKAFEGLAAQSSETGWYGSGGWQPLAISQSLQDFNSNVGSTLSASPPSWGGGSSGTAGGVSGSTTSGFSDGFSGGGGGGGGGGSW